MKAREIAEKFAGSVVNVKVTKSSAVAGIITGQSFKARIVGWKKATTKDPIEYVAVEVLPPGQTKYLLSDLAGASGYVWTLRALPKDKYGKKILPEEIIALPEMPINGGVTIPSYKPKKIINEWPHKCRDCGSPAQMFSVQIDCSNKACKNKYKTHSGLDLFLPKEMQEALNKPASAKKVIK
jgi:hypothetical protein